MQGSELSPLLFVNPPDILLLSLVLMELSRNYSNNRINHIRCHLNNSPVGQSVVLHQEGCLLGQFLLCVNVVGHVAELLLHHPHSLEVCRVIKCIALQQQQFDEVSGDVAP